MSLSFDNSTLVSDLIKSVFREASKKASSGDSAYKTSSLRCLTDLVHFSSSQLREAIFEDYWTSFVLNSFEKELDALRSKESRVRETLKAKLEGRDETVQQPKSETAGEEAKTDSKKPDDAEMEEEGENEIHESSRIIILETMGKCWPYSSELQGKPY